MAVLMAMAAVLGPGSGPAGAARAGKRTTFHGHISAGTGALGHAHGQVTVVTDSSGSGQSVRVTLTLRCRRGGGGTCLRGRAAGTATARRNRIPDTGSTFDLRASGRVAPLGQVSATGSATGTGFIRTGRFTLHLALTGHGSSVTVDARSGPERGFSSPF